MAKAKPGQPRSPAALERQVARWNAANPVGCTVKFHPVIGGAKYTITTTKGEAYILSGHTAVVFLDGIRGCVALDACERIEAGRG